MVVSSGPGRCNTRMVDWSTCDCCRCPRLKRSCKHFCGYGFPVSLFSCLHHYCFHGSMHVAQSTEKMVAAEQTMDYGCVMVKQPVFVNALTPHCCSSLNTVRLCEYTSLPIMNIA